MAAIFSAIDLSTAVTAITAILVIGIGISMAFKGSSLGKRAVGKA